MEKDYTHCHVLAFTSSYNLDLTASPSHSCEIFNYSALEECGWLVYYITKATNLLEQRISCITKTSTTMLSISATPNSLTPALNNLGVIQTSWPTSAVYIVYWKHMCGESINKDYESKLNHSSIEQPWNNTNRLTHFSSIYSVLEAYGLRVY